MEKKWTGDKGETHVNMGQKASKSDKRVHAIGTIDELNSFIGFLRDQDIDMYNKEILIRIQEKLFETESLLAADSDQSAKGLPKIKEEPGAIDLTQ